jgi:hypothetical protein
VDKINIESTLLIYDSVKYFVPYIEDKGIKCFSSFRSINKLEKYLRKFSMITGFYKEEWYGEWKKQLGHIETVIVFATNRYDYITFLADNYPNIRIIVWYWNPVFRCFDPNLLRKKNIEFWSFDREDCTKYNLKYNTTFYFDTILIKNIIQEKDYLFLGADKGRKESLIQLKNKLIERNVSADFYIVPDKNESNADQIKPVRYNEYLHMIEKCRGIIDYIQPGQAGLTLRPLEALFFKKKLITNDTRILNEDFYNANNIFVLNHDNWDEILSFTHSCYIDILEEVVEKYDFLNWLNRFNTNE